MLYEICLSALQQKGLDNDLYINRLKSEVKDLEALNAVEYLISLRDKCIEENLVLEKNDNNLLVAYLLGITNQVDIDKTPEYEYGEFPDIDVDFLGIVRDYIRNEWIPKTFGEENICNISTYQTLGIKQSLQDVARVHGLDVGEVTAITTTMGGKDDDQNVLTWDKALELYPEFNDYCERNPQVAADAKLMLSRNKARGKHAGGIIISSCNISDFVPLEMAKDGSAVSAWTEGLSAQDLQPVGLVKFDLLVIVNNLQVAIACDLIKKRHGLENICGFPGGKNWSDTSYLNDPKAIEMANRGDLRGIFQFDSEGIRKLVREIGIERFDDLVAISALYRPACMKLKMHERYAKRKNGLEKYEIYPALRSVLETTYGVMVYQEQVMKILNIVGLIPLKDCEAVRKAISKKKIEKFIKYKESFIENGQRILNASKEEVEAFWDQVEAFAGYGFNLSHSCAYTVLSARMLWLKAHYPLEFFTAVLSCEDDENKIREYKLDAANHGVILNKIDLNKSRETFSITDDQIYYGFSNLKGVGKEIAKKVVDNQVYSNITEFFEKFGTEASVFKSLICLGAFDHIHPDRIHLCKFYDHYKAWKKKKADRNKRYDKSIISQDEQLKELLKDHPDLAFFNEECYEKWKMFDNEIVEHREEEVVDVDYLKKKYNLDRKSVLEKLEELTVSEGGSLPMTIKVRTSKYNLYNELLKVKKKREKSLDDLEYKIGREHLSVPDLNGFNPNPDDYHVSSDFQELLLNKEAAEKEYYGFLWNHPLEKSPDFHGGLTIENLIVEAEVGGLKNGPIEVVIVNCKEMISKNGNPYYLCEVEDANCVKINVIFWQDDYNRFKHLLFKGNFVRMRVSPPNGGFRSLTFWGPPKKDRYKFIPKDPNEDTRLIVLRKPIADSDIDQFKLTEEQDDD